MADPGKNKSGGHNGAGSDRNHAQNGRNGHGQRLENPTASQATFDARSLWPSLQSWIGGGVRRLRSQVLRRTATTGPEMAPSGGGEDRLPPGSRPEGNDQAAPSRSGTGVTETDGNNPHRRLNEPPPASSRISMKVSLKKQASEGKNEKVLHFLYYNNSAFTTNQFNFTLCLEPTIVSHEKQRG
ncbi:hypothetical protein M5D96_009503 [Drosophila gunungcola]|uniref:Uncharacterized protein n=1 Tax=Drosophila gunungcola TaxID=103775 RepID=A0A9Q0BMY5_9MUSC|nr:hypothetical protein M5D96_009503 [Drosophila gunungcola]